MDAGQAEKHITIREQRCARCPLYGRSEEGEELILRFASDADLWPAAFLHEAGVYLLLRGHRGSLRAPLISGELRHYFPDIRNYYYLPAEDMAVHKSVSQYVERSHRVRATRENCYVRREGRFLPLLPDPGGRGEDSLSVPLLQRDHRDRQRYMEYTEKQDLEPYLLHVLSHFLSD